MDVKFCAYFEGLLGGLFLIPHICNAIKAIYNVR